MRAYRNQVECARATFVNAQHQFEHIQHVVPVLLHQIIPFAHCPLVRVQILQWLRDQLDHVIRIGARLDVWNAIEEERLV